MKLRKERPNFSASTGFQPDLSSQSTVPNRRLENEFHWESSQKLGNHCNWQPWLISIHNGILFLRTGLPPAFFMTFEGAFTKHKSEQQGINQRQWWFIPLYQLYYHSLLLGFAFRWLDKIQKWFPMVENNKNHLKHTTNSWRWLFLENFPINQGFWRANPSLWFTGVGFWGGQQNQSWGDQGWTYIIPQHLLHYLKWGSLIGNLYHSCCDAGTPTSGKMEWSTTCILT